MKSLDKREVITDISQIWEMFGVKLGNMRLIVLTGLVSVEKLALAVELAEHIVARGQSVSLIDNVRRLQIENVDTGDVALIRVESDLESGLLPALQSLSSDVVILAVSESVQPDALFTLLDSLHDTLSRLDVKTLALIDTRTCDCFPQFRVTLEEYADYTVNLPVDVSDVVEMLG